MLGQMPDGAYIHPERHQVIAVDLRGHGLSSNPEQGYRWVEDYASDVLRLLSTLTSEPAVLVGHSLGAMVSIPIAGLAPEKVAALVLEDPPLYDHNQAGTLFWEEKRAFLHLSMAEKVTRLIQQGNAPDQGVLLPWVPPFWRRRAWRLHLWPTDPPLTCVVVLLHGGGCWVSIGFTVVKERLRRLWCLGQGSSVFSASAVHSGLLSRPVVGACTGAPGRAVYP